ncbi:pyridoxal kinase PdxY [Proteus mirabilis]|uniref:pyridoxal kinase n=1 Tax=Proteus mirabilis TaxID=584 RepID=A0ABD5LWN4_PROMI
MKNILSIQSHVVFGHAGNSAAEFPMRRMGVNVWPLNTVQFSNHTQYPEKWTGCVMSAEHITEIVDGIAAIGKLAQCDAVLSGYLGSAEQGRRIVDIVKKSNKLILTHGTFVIRLWDILKKVVLCLQKFLAYFCEDALPISDIIAPNLLELETLAGGATLHNVDQCVKAARQLCQQGPKIVLVKHLSRAGFRHDRFEMLLVTADHSWHVSRPLVDFGERQPVGVGDLTSGLMLVDLLKGVELKTALEHVAAAVYEVMLKTKEMNEYELQLVAAQDQMVHPTHNFCATQLD